MFLQGSVLTAAETLHVSEGFAYLQKGDLASQDPSPPPNILLYGLWLQSKETGHRDKICLWLAAWSPQEHRSTPAPQLGSAPPPGTWFAFSLKKGEEWEKVVTSSSVFIQWNSKQLLSLVRLCWLLVCKIWAVAERSQAGNLEEHAKDLSSFGWNVCACTCSDSHPGRHEQFWTLLYDQDCHSQSSPTVCILFFFHKHLLQEAPSKATDRSLFKCVKYLHFSSHFPRNKTSVNSTALAL